MPGIHIGDGSDKVMTRDRKLVLALGLFLLLRVVVAAVFGQTSLAGTDGESYNAYALAITKNADWLTKPDFYGDFRAPGYPMFIAIVYSLFGNNNFLAVYIIQALIATLTCFYIYIFARELFDNRVAYFSLIWSGFYIFYLDYVRLLMRETLVIFLLLAIFYHLYRHMKSEVHHKFHFYLIPLLYVILIHTDPRYIFYLPFFLLCFLTFLQAKPAVLDWCKFVIITMIISAPWMLRNLVAYDSFVLISSRTYDSRANVRGDSMTMNYMKSNVFDFDIISWTTNKDYPTEEERALVKKGVHLNGRSGHEVMAIRNDVYPDSTYLARKWFQFKEFWRPFRFNSEYRPFPDCRFVYWSLRHNIISIICYGFLLPFLLYGVFVLFRIRTRVMIFLVAPLFVQCTLHVLQWSQTRYRVPIDSFIIMLAAYGFGQLYVVLKQRKQNGYS